MAKPVDYTPQPVATDTAEHELVKLAETLHERGVLRLLNNLVAESHGVAEVALNQLDTPGGKRLVNNATVLLDTLTKIDDAALNRLLSGLAKGVNAAAHSLDDNAKPPGTFGLVRELNDPDVRRGLTAVLTLLGTLGKHLKS